jgi:autotransporter translocation and assembly factor TamB
VQQSSSLGDKATTFVTGQLIKQITQSIETELNLDMLQIKSGQDLEETRVKVGKYITPNVFVIISQDFGSQGNQKIELEYELPPKILFFNLFLEAFREKKGETGLDVIWKVEW